jgi:hypothetical protein
MLDKTLFENYELSFRRTNEFSTNGQEMCIA